jgi:hypothetical protein
MFGRTLPTVARESEPTPERLNEPGLKFGERIPPMLGDMRRPLEPKLEGARKLPMLGEVRMPPNEEPPKDGEWRLPMLGEEWKPPNDGEA